MTPARTRRCSRSFHVQTVFQRFPMRVSTRLAETEKIGNEGLALPLYSHMTDEQREFVCEQVEKLLR